MTKTSGHGRRGGCTSSRKSVINMGWRKTAHMATTHPQIWKKQGSHLWHDRSSNTTGGTVFGGEERHSLRASGAHNQIVMLAGGWGSPSVARHYTKPKHVWKFVERGEPPVLVCGENVYCLVCGDLSSKQWWPAWLRKELRELAAEARIDGDVLGPAGQAARKRRRTRSGGPPGAK